MRGLKKGGMKWKIDEDEKSKKATHMHHESLEFSG